MSYTAPTVGAAGLTVPSYTDILGLFTSAFLNIYGQTYYLGNDSPAYQLLSVLALAASDGNSVLQQAVGDMSPSTAIGAGLSALVLLNGLQRKVASFSTCLVTLTGTAGAVITNGVVQNAATGDLWNLPATVTIGGGGTVVVTATAQKSGLVNALANQLTTMVNPTSGWISVTNGSNVATLGQPVETDSQLRNRQSVSVELPSETLAAGTMAAILAVPGVTRINNNPALSVTFTTSFENFTNAMDAFGNPAHSISPVVDGGADADVAAAIYNNRGLGVLTNGSTGGTLVTVAVTDPNSAITININFARPALVPIYVKLQPHVLPGGSTGVLGPLVQAAIANYLNSLQLGATISFGELVAAANSLNPVNGPPIYSVRSLNFFFGTTSTPSTATDVSLLFYQAPQGVTGNVTVAWV